LEEACHGKPNGMGSGDVPASFRQGLGRRAEGDGRSVGAAVPKLFSKARASKFRTDDGMEYIDCTSQAWSLGIGACHPFVMEAVKEQLNYFTHVRTNFDTVPKLLLSKKLSEIGPGDLKRVPYCLHGSTAVEGAMKLAMRSRPGRKYFVSLWNGYSGRSLARIDMTDPHPTPFLHYTGNKLRVPQLYCHRCPYQRTCPACDLSCVEMMGKMIENSLDGESIALLMDPIQATGSCAASTTCA
jgi:4-aminobutyrate aminotransferase-like enzyme